MTAANRTTNAGLTSAVIISIAGTALMTAGPLPPNIATAARPGSGALRAREVPSAAACAGVTVGRKRASAEKIVTRWAPCSPSTAGTAHGVHARVSRSGNANSGGMTPTTVNGLPPTCTTLPTAASRPPNCSCHKPYDRMITSADAKLPPGRPSSSTKSRPRKGRALSTVKSDGVTDAVRSRVASPPPTLAVVGTISQPPISSMVEGRACQLM